uniref:Tryptophan-rich basic protein n=1 Tax=Parascaris univalens TaxID=6257 RepID=A0A915BEA5_PARUN
MEGRAEKGKACPGNYLSSQKADHINELDVYVRLAVDYMLMRFVTFRKTLQIRGRKS